MLIHLACTLGNTYLIETLLEKDADKNYLDANNHSTTDFLRFNPNYMERKEFILLKKLLEPNVLSKILIKKMVACESNHFIFKLNNLSTN